MDQTPVVGRDSAHDVGSILSSLGSYLVELRKTFSMTSIPPAQPATSTTYERPSSGSMNLTRLRRGSSSDGC